MSIGSNRFLLSIHIYINPKRSSQVQFNFMCNTICMCMVVKTTISKVNGCIKYTLPTDIVFMFLNENQKLFMGIRRLRYYHYFVHNFNWFWILNLILFSHTYTYTTIVRRKIECNLFLPQNRGFFQRFSSHLMNGRWKTMRTTRSRTNNVG